MELYDQNRIVISQPKLDSINSTKKRPCNPQLWRDNVAKLRRNSGLDYVGRSGIPKPAKGSPELEKVCWIGCRLPGCIEVNLQDRLRLRDSYYSMNEYNTQRTYLLTMIDKDAVQNENLKEYRYYVKPNGMRLEVCRTTWMDTFQITKKAVENIQRRLNEGTIFARDGRGQHGTRNRNDPRVFEMMQQQIRRFLQFECHYSRREHPVYHSPDLTVSKMFRLFLNENPDHPDFHHKENLYRRVFRETGLHIGIPKSDTCGICDSLNIQINVLPHNGRRADLESSRTDHHDIVDIAYLSLENDIARSRQEEDYIVLVGDMEKVLFTPTLTHTEMYYLRQLSTYNYCVHNGSDGLSSMFVWSEVDGNRGVDEVASSFFTYVQNNFVRLVGSQRRHLVIWSDRCRGQVNNYHMLVFLRYLIVTGYFTSAEQKFLQTGHSFLPCDSDFALIEKNKKGALAYVPQDWVNIIRNTRVAAPFTMYEMNRETILNFKTLEQHVPRPANLQVTKFTWYSFSLEDVSSIYAREDFSTGVWRQFTVHRPNQLGIRHANRALWTNECLNNVLVAQKYNNRIAVSAAKFQNLMTMIPFMPLEYRPFYENLPHE